jgi:hypothetical protein
MKLRIALFCLFVSYAQFAETLRDVLLRNHIPTTNLTKKELDSKVSSGAEQQFDGSVVLAYPSEKDGGMLPPLHVIRFDRANHRVLHRELSSEQIGGNDECFGSVLEISEFAGRLFVVTHINPSASCTLMLDAARLTWQKSYLGWPVAHLGQTAIVLEEDQVQFAPVHPLRLRIIGVATKTDLEIFPPGNDPLRKEFSAALKEPLPDRKWCEENNNPCDPANFEQELRYGPGTNAAGTRFGFVVSYETQSFGDETERTIGTWFVLYVYKKTEAGWVYCEQKLDDAHVDDVGAQLKPNFDRVAHTCAEFQQVSVTPADGSRP